MEASVRTADRVVTQTGQLLGPRTDCEILLLTSAQEAALRAAYAQPHGAVYISAAGAVTFDPFVPPAPLPPPSDQTAFDAAVTQLRATFNTTRTAQQMNNSIDALTVVMRRLFRELQ